MAWLEAKHHPDNAASGRVLAKVGFTRIGVVDLHAGDVAGGLPPSAPPL
ncbi:GNAT family protein [Streptomyces sp. H34-AA3]|nr:GNAT family protein [Streptomyces sp. H34-AA3]